MRRKTHTKFIAIFLTLLSLGGLTPTTVTVFASDSTSFVGLKKSKTSTILDTFKENQKEILFDKSPFTPEEEQGLFETEGKIRNLEEVIARVEASKSFLKEKKLEVTSQKFTLQSMLAEIDGEIELTEKNIADAEEGMRAKNREIADVLRGIVQLQDRISTNKEAILGYLGYIYSKGGLMYGENKDIDIVRTLIFTDGNVSDVLTDYHFMTILEITGQNFLEERRALLRDYYTESQMLKDEKKKVLQMKNSLEASRKILEEQRAYKNDLLIETRGQEALFNEYISDRQQKQAKIEYRLSEAMQLYEGAFETIAARSGCEIIPNQGIVASTQSGSSQSQSGAQQMQGSVARCTELDLSFQSEKKLRSFGTSEAGVNPLKWPVTPNYISAYFQDADYFDSVGSSHEGIDIPVPQGTDIAAPMPGYVYFINAPTEKGYGYMAIKHPNGFMTVYGHVSEILVQKYDFVEAGQVFAKSGGAPGTKGAGVMTSGAHLHLELWLNREPVDALRYMDITQLRYESLATKYKYKFIEDLKLRYGYLANTQKYDTFSIRGDSETERQKYLLEKYATTTFRDWKVWTEEAVGAKVDPSFLMCIGLAETGLGRNLKTPYNVGNIGNTDSGATQDFFSARDGIYWMAKTLNNKYLGEYQSVSDLSRWGNKTGAIYASSPKNWQENIIRCLSALKGRFVEDDYKFRLNPQDELLTQEDRISERMEAQVGGSKN